MTRHKEKENFALMRYRDIAGETDYKDTAALEGIIVGANWADKTMIDKACEILKNVTVTYNKRFFGKCEENAFDADFIKEFRQAMEE